ncbi:MAG: Photosystem I reaction center subunit III [Microcystis sp. M048S1]|jgi:photosystem I subunit 3|uniref:Photosystem I reaction center subunit III n=1 Tax=unclassified Microcystis TaxID=2643300 RepID=UPI001197338D|nr:MULTISPECIES: Photosystem I reaction center subunit III [unclassified Microcystis]MCA2901987.1 Photosystem I reaction center subunit III [Microcystis sp. M035S1]MDJ0524188.1 Photosystem I reaction center subunit III [Microcystis sp. M53600_WE12]NCQ95680.1 Photosystem I reaction center subunit III [Microcystis aeruginosa W11-03]NCR58711.1 Photosystem I reaction center subunit III [Microcystis aeruginosa LL13-06]NCR94232.1 Photosystem I reaction center subunit III [Microcystis aeruginosa W11-
MRKLFALALVLSLWFTFAAPASADLSNLTPCSENPAFLQKAKSFRNTTLDPESGAKRAQTYSQALCGPEGYPHLIVDGRWDHMGDFFIPSILFLYIAGWIGWVGRAYLIAVRDSKDAEMKEIIIDVPLALSKMLTGFLWPLAALQEATSGKLTVKDSEITVSPR